MNIKLQKSMASPLILLIIGLIIVIGVVYYITNQQKEGDTSSKETGEIMTEKSLRVPLMSRNNSGESGSAIITEVDGKAKVVLSLTGTPLDVSQPVHIHRNSCDNLGEIEYPLTSAINGSSETMLEVSISEILSGRPLAINVHKSGSEAGIYVSCGDISPTALIDKDTVEMMMETDSVKDAMIKNMDDAMMIDIMEMTYDYSGQLADVTRGNDVRGINTGSSSYGVAMAIFKNTSYMLLATFENLPDPQGTDFYEGWVVRKGSKFSVISTGKITKVDGRYRNMYSSGKDLTDHTFYVLTIEPADNDPAPADHILEGTMIK